MGHQRGGASASVRDGLDEQSASAVAQVLQGLATPSRLHIISALSEGPLSVGTLATTIGMESSAVSHQLRHLRELGLVTAERQGRSIVYALFDEHVLDIIDQALAHTEHLDGSSS
ncbi:metalloregulator ArsR/SmtB family transcription factor [Nocardioides flavescens]|uniref:Metalloregulator ArsR/SmtB family transcription factor n=1 Tax=Nocardioides flavescens TaxID=2691959 RepID=A0A6L7EU64_9ACTN|nr:metalloregulator ArsR/SmtB family transcription factor [Nocardioides flavescens]